MADNNSRRNLRDSERTVSHSGQTKGQGRFSPKRPLFWLTMVGGIAAVAVLAAVLIPLLGNRTTPPASNDGNGNGGGQPTTTEETTTKESPSEPDTTPADPDAGITQPSRFEAVLSHLQTGGGAFLIENDSAGELYYGLDFQLDRYDEDGWDTIEPDEPMMVPMIAMIVEAGDAVFFQANWEPYYGDLEIGRYRLVKNGGSERPWYAEFEITDKTAEGPGLTPPPMAMHEDISRIVTDSGISLNFDPESKTLTVKNDSDETVTYGKYFFLLQPIAGLDNADPADPYSYHFVPMSGEAAFEDIGLMLEPDAEGTEQIDLGFYYAELPAGDYVMVRAFWGDGEYEERVAVTGSFTLNDAISQSTDPTEGEVIGEETAVNPDVPELDGALFELVHGTLTQQGGVFRIVNNTDDVVMTGADWELMTWGGDRWVKVDPIEEPFWIEIMYEIQPGETHEFTADWTAFYGVLEPGEYALSKTLTGLDDNPWIANFEVTPETPDHIENDAETGAGTDGDVSVENPDVLLPGDDPAAGSSELALFHLVDGTLTRSGGSFMINNPTDDDFETGADWQLVRWADEGWQVIEPDEEPVWIMILYTIPAHDSMEFHAEWEPCYGKLEPGVYGLSKQVHGSAMNPFLAMFEITEDTP